MQLLYIMIETIFSAALAVYAYNWGYNKARQKFQAAKSHIHFTVVGLSIQIKTFGEAEGSTATINNNGNETHHILKNGEWETCNNNERGNPPNGAPTTEYKMTF